MSEIGLAIEVVSRGATVGEVWPDGHGGWEARAHDDATAHARSKAEAIRHVRERHQRARQRIEARRRRGLPAAPAVPGVTA